MIRREILKEVLLDNRNEVVKHQVIPRSFQFEEFGNYAKVPVSVDKVKMIFLLAGYLQIHNFQTLQTESYEV
jgi:hypothetical protein